jgi:hypothetical protein
MVSEPKDQTLLVRLSATEAQMLTDLSESTGTSRAAVLRQLLRREHAKVIGPAKPKKPKR